MNLKPETIKLLEENIGNKLFDVGLDNFFFNLYQKQSNKIKRQLTEWEIVFVSHISDKWLISKIYKQLKQLVK